MKFKIIFYLLKKYKKKEYLLIKILILKNKVFNFKK